MINKKTKIVCTISDINCEVEFIRDLYERGLNVVRMNTAHANDEGIKRLIANVREVSENIPILIDPDFISFLIEITRNGDACN